MKSKTMAMVFVGLGLLACGDVDLGDETFETEDDTHRIATQNPNGATAEIMATRYLIDPDVTMVSYAATGPSSGCSGTMIGPNIALTAAHCGYNDHNFGFQTYREQDPQQAEREYVLCEPLYQTFSDTDMLLMYCPPINGVNPGDRYGYVDLDPRQAQVGDQLYSVWRNPVDDVGGGQHMLFSDGEVLDDKAQGWMTPNGYDNTAILSSLFSAPGASGSAQFSVDRNEILVGPLSVGPGGGGPKRWALSMFDYRSRATVDDPADINDPVIQNFGLNPGDYLGGTDKDGDQQLDIQTDVEKVTGEGARDHYTLTFSSERQNALWTSFPGQSDAKFHPDSQLVHFGAHGGASTVEALRHERLNVKSSTRYRVSVMVHANKTISNGLEIGFDGDFGQYGWSPVSSESIDLVAGTGWVMHTFELKSSWTNASALTIRKRPGADASIAALSIIEQGSTMDFDLHDKRFHWRNDNNGDRAFILPDGTGGGVNWAAAVVRTDGIPSGNDWPVRSRQLALLPNTNYQMCFDFRKFAGHPGSHMEGTVRVSSDGQVVYEQVFDANDPNWDTLCTDNFTTQGSDNLLQFGIDAIPPDEGVPSGAVYLVDNLQLDEI